MSLKRPFSSVFEDVGSVEKLWETSGAMRWMRFHFRTVLRPKFYVHASEAGTGSLTLRSIDLPVKNIVAPVLKVIYPTVAKTDFLAQFHNAWQEAQDGNAWQKIQAKSLETAVLIDYIHTLTDGECVVCWHPKFVFVPNGEDTHSIQPPFIFSFKLADCAVHGEV